MLNVFHIERASFADSSADRMSCRIMGVLMGLGYLLCRLCGRLVIVQRLWVNYPSSSTIPWYPHSQIHCRAEVGDVLVAVTDNCLLIKVKRTMHYVCVFEWEGDLFVLQFTKVGLREEGSV